MSGRELFLILQTHFDPTTSRTEASATASACTAIVGTRASSAPTWRCEERRWTSSRPPDRPARGTSTNISADEELKVNRMQWQMATPARSHQTSWKAFSRHYNRSKLYRGKLEANMTPWRMATTLSKPCFTAIFTYIISNFDAFIIWLRCRPNIRLRD